MEYEVVTDQLEDQLLEELLLLDHLEDHWPNQMTIIYHNELGKWESKREII